MAHPAVTKVRPTKNLARTARSARSGPPHPCTLNAQPRARPDKRMGVAGGTSSPCLSFACAPPRTRGNEFHLQTKIFTTLETPRGSAAASHRGSNLSDKRHDSQVKSLQIIVFTQSPRRRAFFVAALLGFPQLGVGPAAGEQPGVGTGLDDAPVFQHHDLIGVHHGREAVGDDERGGSA